MTFGLTSAGFNPRRAADFLTIMRDKYETDTGLDIDWDADVVFGNWSADFADLLGQESELTNSIYDSWSVGNATGLQLDSLCAAVGIYRQEPTYSQTTVTLTATAGTFIAAGKIVEGGGEEGDARWITSEAVTSTGSDSVVVVAEEPGAIVATIGEIDKIVTPVSGWSGVTNAADATVGDARETDAELRIRRAESLQVSGAASANAIRANISALTYLTAAVVVENDRSTVQSVQGLLMDPNAIYCVVYPDSLTTAQEQEIAETIYTKMPVGIYSQGVDVVQTVTDDAGGSKVIRFDYADTLAVNIVYVLSYETGYSLTDVETALETAITSYFATLNVGDSVTYLDMLCLAGSITGIKGVTTLTLNGGTSDIDPTIIQLATEGTVGIS